jgi:acetyl-CoA carboxylase carboxyltransferase component
VTVVLRKAYGAGYYVMCGRGYQPDTIVAWPGAEISVMGPEGAVDIIFTKQIAAAEDPVAERAKLVETVRQSIDPYVAASWAMVDDIIDPAETREVICNALESAATKHLERPWRKHGVPPV